MRSYLIPALVLVCSALQIHGQAGEVYKGFKLLDYYKPANTLKSQIKGGEAQTQRDGIVVITKGVRIENYLQDGTTNLTATAPDCFVNPKTQVAYSTNRLDVETAHG